MNKHVFYNIINKIINQLQEKNKLSRVKIITAKSIKNQNMLHIQEIKTLEISIIFLKHMTNILKTQRRKL